jgi:hypothetical protein
VIIEAVFLHEQLGLALFANLSIWQSPQNLGYDFYTIFDNAFVII